MRKLFVKKSAMNLTHLRAEAPAWTWRARRGPWGWQYDGTRGDERVKVYPVGHVGQFEDDVETVWMVDDGRREVTYAAWWVTACGD